MAIGGNEQFYFLRVAAGRAFFGVPIELDLDLQLTELLACFIRRHKIMSEC